VEVKDTGVGISKSNLRKIFDPFFSTKSEGTGLGLSISLKILENHGATIDVESEEGKGSTFTIHLPVAQGSGDEKGRRGNSRRSDEVQNSRDRRRAHSERFLKVAWRPQDIRVLTGQERRRRTGTYFTKSLLISFFGPLVTWDKWR
jgi:hypothetical protein